MVKLFIVDQTLKLGFEVLKMTAGWPWFYTPSMARLTT